MKELKVAADVNSLQCVLDFIDEQLDAVECPLKIKMQLDIAVEEMFVNIANYAYSDGSGTAVIRIEYITEPPSVEITFTDNGIPYNPLAKADPDITLSAEERPIGGLGIFMVKKSMDSVFYEYKDNTNIFKMKKIFCK